MKRKVYSCKQNKNTKKPSLSNKVAGGLTPKNVSTFCCFVLLVKPPMNKTWIRHGAFLKSYFPRKTNYIWRKFHAPPPSFLSENPGSALLYTTNTKAQLFETDKEGHTTLPLLLETSKGQRQTQYSSRFNFQVIGLYIHDIGLT